MNLGRFQSTLEEVASCVQVGTLSSFWRIAVSGSTRALRRESMGKKEA
jgi:hypothetical protein